MWILFWISSPFSSEAWRLKAENWHLFCMRSSIQFWLGREEGRKFDHTNWERTCRNDQLTAPPHLAPQSASMHTSSCWSCKGNSTTSFGWLCLPTNSARIIDSRASCDRIYPRCSRCSKHDKPCQYGLRLSWPKANNKKRSLVQTIQDGLGATQNSSMPAFVNASNWDIQLHDYLWMSQGLIACWQMPTSN